MYLPFKRFFDLVLALLVLALMSWLLLPCMLILWCTGEHYVWYCQERVGYRNSRFRIIKFATMLKDSPHLGAGSLTVRHDPRVLPFGRFLRRTKLNELPQVFNVLNGTMSVVGPRPQMEVDFLRYPPRVQARIYDAKPGITGIGSLIFRDEEYYLSRPGVDPTKFYSEQIAPYKGALELWYLEHRSLWVDLLIILLTAWVLVFKRSQLPYKIFRDLPSRPDWMEA